MYGIPESLNLNAFLNEEILIVHLGKHIFHLIFGDNLAISCEGQVIVEKDGVSTTIRNEGWENLNPLIAIQSVPVIEYNIDSKKNFSLKLSNNTKITFTDNSDKYESFQIRIGKDPWII